MKKVILPIFLSGILMFSGCQSKEKKQQELKQNIKTYIEEHNTVSEEMLEVDKGWLEVAGNNYGEVSINVRAFMPYYIPYIADGIIPVIKDALKEYGATINQLDVIYFRNNNKGPIRGTIVYWETKDFETGTFEAEEKEGDILIENATLQDVYDVYAEWDWFVKSILAGMYD